VLARQHPALIAAADFDSILHSCEQDAVLVPGAPFKDDHGACSARPQ
jgi:hypothetical protein